MKAKDTAKKRGQYLSLRWDEPTNQSLDDVDQWYDDCDIRHDIDDEWLYPVEGWLVHAVGNCVLQAFTFSLGQRIPADTCPVPDPVEVKTPEGHPPVPAEALAFELHRLIHEFDCHPYRDFRDQLPSIEDVQWLLEAVVEQSADSISDHLVTRAFREYPPLATAVFFSRFWLRPLRSWKIPSGCQATRMRSLLDHLFVRYPVPECLYTQWLSTRHRTNGLGHQDLGKGAASDIKWAVWFILIAQGASLHKAGPIFRWDVPKGFERHLLSCAATPWPREACMWAEIMRVGGSLVEYRRLISNPGFVLDPTAVKTDSWCGLDSETWDFWRTTLEWLIRHRDAVTDEQCSLILEWAMHEHTETRYTRYPTFTWKGRTPAKAYEAALRYQKSLNGAWGAYTWQSHNLTMEYDDAEGVKWSMIELTSGDMLLEEGEAQHHCVATYAPRCAFGNCAIFSLRLGGLRVLTIEVLLSSRKVVQARGACNRAPTAGERNVLKYWCKTVLRGSIANSV